MRVEEARVGPWRAVLRMARRYVWRSKARSTLVMALIGLPVLVLAAGTVVYHSYQLTQSVAYARANGAASAEITYAGGPVVQAPDIDSSGADAVTTSTARGWPSPSPTSREPDPSEVAKALGPGSRVIERLTLTYGTVVTRAGLGLVTFVGVDLADPVTRGLVDPISGHPATNARQVAVTEALAREAGLHIGSTLRTYDPAKTFRVVGVVADVLDADTAAAYFTPAAVPRADAAVDFLARTDRPVTWAEVRRLNAHGYVVESRYVAAHPPPSAAVAYHAPSSTRLSRRVLVSWALGAGLALMEVILLAGPAFAVMARRSRHTLALVAACGGRSRDLRNVVIATALVLGVTAGLAAAALGVAAGAAALPLVVRFHHVRPGPLRVPVTDLLGAAAVAVVTAVAAALVPAHQAARTDVLASLAGRRPPRRTRKRVPVAVILAAAAGVVVALAGASRDDATVPILTGVALVEVGLILATPLLLDLLSRRGRRLPLPLRLALRDTSRNRSAASPAVAAVMAAVLGCAAVLIGAASQTALDQRSYQPSALTGEVSVQLSSPAAVAAVIRATSAALGTSRVYAYGTVAGSGSSVLGGDTCTHGACYQTTIAPYVPDGTVRQSRWIGSDGTGQLTVITPDTAEGALRALTGRAQPAAAAALRAGKAVLVDAWAVHGSRARLEVTADPTVIAVPISRNNADSIALGNKAKTTSRLVSVPAVAMTSGFPAAEVIVPPSLLRVLGVGSANDEVLADPSHAPSTAQLQSLRAALARIELDYPLSSGDQMAVSVERGFRDPHALDMLLMILACAVVAVGAAGIATGLSNVDRRDDFLTLGAVGASPHTRRVLSAARAGLIAGLGALLGTAAGFVPALAWIDSTNHHYGVTPKPPTVAPGQAGLVTNPLYTVSTVIHLVVPWASLLALVIGIPLLAAAVAGTVSRSRLPSERTTP